MNAKLRTSILAAAIAALPLGVQAAGLGNIHVKSVHSHGYMAVQLVLIVG